MKTKAAISQDGLPKNLLNRFGEHVTGFLNGLDRVRFRATLRPLFCPNGPLINSFLHRYQLTAKGRRIITALLAASYADVDQLTKIAA